MSYELHGLDRDNQELETSSWERQPYIYGSSPCQLPLGPRIHYQPAHGFGTPWIIVSLYRSLWSSLRCSTAWSNPVANSKVALEPRVLGRSRSVPSVVLRTQKVPSNANLPVQTYIWVSYDPERPPQIRATFENGLWWASKIEIICNVSKGTRISWKRKLIITT